MIWPKINIANVINKMKHINEFTCKTVRIKFSAWSKIHPIAPIQFECAYANGIVITNEKYFFDISISIVIISVKLCVCVTNMQFRMFHTFCIEIFSIQIFYNKSALCAIS